MKIFRFELKKLARNMLLWIFVLALSVLVFLSVSNSISTSKTEKEKVLTEVLNLYNNNPEQFQQYIDNFILAYKASVTGPVSQRPSKPESIYSSDDYRLFTEDLDQIINFSSYYQNSIKEAIRIANGKINACKYLGYSEDSFEWTYYRNLISSYQSLQNYEFHCKNIVGYDIFFSYSDASIYTMFLVVIIAVFSISVEKGNNMLFILHSSKNGRTQTLFAKFFAGLAATAFATILLFLITLCSIGIKIGFSGFSEPIQMIEQMKYCPYPISIGEGLALVLLCRCFTAFTLFTVAFLISILLNHTLLSFLASSLFIGANYGIANVNFLNNYSLLKNINLFWSIDGTKYIDQWQGVLIFSRCVSRTPLLLIFYSFIITFCLLLSWLAFARLQAGSIRSKALTKAWDRFSSFFSLRIRTTSSFLFEAKKIITPVSLILFIACILGGIYLSYSSFKVKKDYIMSTYSEYMNSLEGEWTQEKQNLIDEKIDHNEEIIQQYEYMSYQFEKGTISQTEYSTYLNQMSIAQQDNAVLKKIQSHGEYLKELTESGKKGYFFDDTWCTYLSKYNFSYILCLALIAVFSDVYAYEHRTGFFPIQRVLPNGRRKTDFTKLLVVFLLTLVISLLFELIQYYFVQKGFGFSGLSFTAQSIEGVRCSENMTVLSYFILQLIKNVFLYVVLSFAVVILSCVSQKQLVALIIPVFLIFTPTILSFFGYSSLNSLSFLGLFGR